MDSLSYPFPASNVDYPATSDISGYHPNTEYWNWVNFYYRNGFHYDQPSYSGFTPTSTTPTPSTSSGSYFTATPVFSATPSMLTMTPPITTTPHRPKDSSKQCSNCFATETCQ